MLAPGKTPEPDGVSEIETTIDTGIATGNLRVVGSPFGPNTMRVASGGGVMIGSDSDIDVRYRNARLVTLEGGPFGDFLSGRGGAPAAFPAPSTTNVLMVGQGGNDTLVDGPLSGDTLIGNFGDDTLFGLDGSFLDTAGGGDGFDQATLDLGDRADSTTEKVTLPLGRLRLTPTTVKAHVGRSTRVSLAWRHPKSWKQLRSLELRAMDGGKVVGTVRIRLASARITSRGALTATRASTIRHHGKTAGADLRLRASKALAGRMLHLAVRATDIHGHAQNEPLAGNLRVAK